MKLTAEQVAEIRSSSESQRRLAARYGVSPTRIWEIRQGEAYLVENRERNRLWYAKPGNIEKKREQKRRWLAKPGNTQKQRNANRRCAYGVSPAEYATLLAKQGGLCAICQCPETRALRGSVHPLCIDHCHQTGRVRGLLCMSCNSGIGYLGDSLAGLERAAQYLREATTESRESNA